MSSIEEIRRRIGEVGKKLPADELARTHFKAFTNYAEGSIILASSCNSSFVDYVTGMSREFEHLSDRVWRSLPPDEAGKVADELYIMLGNVKEKIIEALNTNCGCKIYLPPKV
jgi:hypothetical protein